MKLLPVIAAAFVATMALPAGAADPGAARTFGTNPHVDDVHVANEVHVWRNPKTSKEPQKVLVHLSTREVGPDQPGATG